jgi:hypothetical protein
MKIWLIGKHGTLILLMLIHVSHLENLRHDFFVGEITGCPELGVQPNIPAIPGSLFPVIKIAGI